MEASAQAYKEALDEARAHSDEWLASLSTRHMGPVKTAAELAPSFAFELPEHPEAPGFVVDELARLAEPGLMAMPSSRFFGWVIGGTLPAALGADWLVSMWDQNAAMRYATPATTAIEEAAGGWLLDLLHLPSSSGVGFTTGATMANFIGLAAARNDVLRQAGWDVNTRGLAGGPPVTVLVGAERHVSVDLALRYLALGSPLVVEADDQGRLIPDALAAALDTITGPTIVCLQAGNLHSGAFDPMAECIELAHAQGAWVHVDGAFGLWAAVSPRYSVQLAGLGDADSWATDAHKTLNVPYDCGVAVVADRSALLSTFSVQASYLIRDGEVAGDPMDSVTEMSRRARGVPVWAALRSLGRSGVIDMVEGLVENARQLATSLAALPGVEIVNDIVFTQVCLSFESDERTRRVTQSLIESGEVWMSGSRWQGRDVLRISVSNWSTNDDDVLFATEAVRRAIAVTA